MPGYSFIVAPFTLSENYGIIFASVNAARRRCLLLLKEGGKALNIATYIPIIVLWIIIFIMFRNRRKTIIARKMMKKRKTGGKNEMKELAVKFMDKECIIYSFDGHQYEGVIKEVSNGGILIERDGKSEAINLDFVVRIREYPRNKNGKKKSVVLD